MHYIGASLPKLLLGFNLPMQRPEKLRSRQPGQRVWFRAHSECLAHRKPGHAPRHTRDGTAKSCKRDAQLREQTRPTESLQPMR